MPTRSERRMGAALQASVLVVLEAVVPRYACCGWGGPSDGRGGKEGRERTRGDLTVVFPRRARLPRDIHIHQGYALRRHARRCRKGVERVLDGGFEPHPV